MSYEFVCQRCHQRKFSQVSKPREYCAKCLKAIDQRSAYLSPHENVKRRLWSQMTPTEIKQDLAFFVGCLADLGPNGPVTHIRPGHPAFNSIASSVTHIKEIRR